MAFFIVGNGGHFRVYFVMICGSEEEIELFQGSFVSESKWMIWWVTFVSFRGVLVDIVGVTIETKNSFCSVPLSRGARVGPGILGRSFGCRDQEGSFGAPPIKFLYPGVRWD